MYEYETRIRYSDTDEDGRMRLLPLLNCLQDTSTFHSHDCGMTTELYREMGRAWFINYWDIFIEGIPRFADRVAAGTSPHDPKGIFARRNFWLRPAGNSPAAADAGAGTQAGSGYYVRADSVWFLCNTETMKPVRLTPGDMAPFGEGRDVLGLGSDAVRKVDIRDFGVLEHVADVPVRREMLDTNHHVNNIRYITAVCDALAEAGVTESGQYPLRIRAEYRYAARYGDILRILARREVMEEKVRITAAVISAGEDKTDFFHTEMLFGHRPA